MTENNYLSCLHVKKTLARKLSQDGSGISSSSKKRRKKCHSTVKDHRKYIVQHNYHDHANEEENSFRKKCEKEDLNCNEIVTDNETNCHARKKKSKSKKGPRGGVLDPFPIKLHRMLEKVEELNLSSIVSWHPHGRSFVVRKPQEFVDEVMPIFFRQTKLTSYQRQLNLYGFSRLTRGIDVGGYYHELFLRGKVFLCHGMVRTKIKGTGHKPANSPETEPNFYRMSSLPNYSHSCNNKDDSEDEDVISHVTPEYCNSIQADQCYLQSMNHCNDVSIPSLIVPSPEISSRKKEFPQSDFLLQGYPLARQDHNRLSEEGIMHLRESYNKNTMNQNYYAENSNKEQFPQDIILSFAGKKFHYLDSKDPLMSHINVHPDELHYSCSTFHCNTYSNEKEWMNNINFDFERGLGSIA